MKRCMVTLAFLALPGLAQRQVSFNASTPEGQLLQQIGQSPDDDKKITLMEDFLSKYPKSENAAWVGGQLELAYNQQKQFDKSLAAAEKAYSGGPNDVDLGFNAIKAAEGKDDIEEIKKWAGRTSEVAQKVASKTPANDDEKADVSHAKEVGSYAEYSLYAQVLKAKDAKAAADLGEALEKANPKSQYLWLASPKYLASLGAKGCATATKLATADGKNAEAFLFAADCGWRGANAPAVLSNANKALEALNSRPKVDGGNEGGKSGQANFFIGIGNAMQQRWGPANKALRAALPSIKGEPTYEANALFSLGMANYQLGKSIGDRGQMREGLRFFEQAAAIKSNVQDQATRNAAAIRAELGAGAK